MADHTEVFNTDSEMDSTNPTTKLGGGAILQMEQSDIIKDPKQFRVVARVDFSDAGDITADNVDSAYCYMYCYSWLVTGGSVFKLQWLKSLRAWVEADVTWNKYDATNDWAAGGGGGLADATSDYESDEVTVTGHELGWFQWDIWDSGGAKSMIKDAIDNESKVWNAWLGYSVSLIEEVNWAGFASSEHSTPNWRPYIVINYTPVEGEPTIAKIIMF